MKKDLRSLNLIELQLVVEGLSEKKFRGTQIFDWLHNKQVQDFSKMGNVPNALKEKLLDEYMIYTVTKARMQESKEDGTRKYLFELHDGEYVESVFMRYAHGNSVCVSSQVGCRMGCSFCASTLDGLVRNLTAGEMLGQVYAIMEDTGERISNVVIMGSGEPFDNYDNVVDFMRLLSHEKGLNISGRNITVSTCGLVDKIRKFADEEMSATLAISLHASNDEKRKRIMPVANSFSIKEIIDACKYFFDKTGRRLTFEYSLIAGVNDSEEDASELSSLLRGLNCHVNLIPVNPVVETGYKSPSKEAAQAFKNKLEKKSINVTIRREMGRDIDGACGQLRRRVKNQEI
ncbi:MAG: 23S rRNA (adenine(2503)-C(2))-methyltransferase RlmN [Lachnospiraceae bacterium]|nr:23S rRNA (adenine(2503)-C(2))-methyltransferase RlmN [Lachnospiraceae bacterium]